MQHEHGRAVENGSGGFLYEYHLKDHLGNTRIRFADINGDHMIDPNESPGNPAEVLSIESHYPFGLKHRHASQTFTELSTATNSRYGYNGKELVPELDLNWMPYGKRMFDPATSRFISVDPIAEDFAWVSPYNYAENEPIANIDLHGLQKIPYYLKAEANKYLGQFNKTTNSNIPLTGNVNYAPLRSVSNKEAAQTVQLTGTVVEAVGLIASFVAPPAGAAIAGVGKALQIGGTTLVAGAEIQKQGEISNSTKVDLIFDVAGSALPGPLDKVIDNTTLEQPVKDLTKSSVNSVTTALTKVAQEGIKEKIEQNEIENCQEKCQENDN